MARVLRRKIWIRTRTRIRIGQGQRLEQHEVVMSLSDLHGIRSSYHGLWHWLPTTCNSIVRLTVEAHREVCDDGDLV